MSWQRYVDLAGEVDADGHPMIGEDDLRRVVAARMGPTDVEEGVIAAKAEMARQVRDADERRLAGATEEQRVGWHVAAEVEQMQRYRRALANAWRR